MKNRERKRKLVNTMASITKRGNTYRVRVFVCEKPDGRKEFKSATFRPDPAKTEKQNQKALDLFVMEFEQKVKNGKYLDGEKMTLQEFADLWLNEYAKDHLTPSTYQMYHDLLYRHVLPEIGNLKLSKVQPVALNRLYKKLLEKPKENGRGNLSPSTVKRVHATLSSLYNTAVKWGVCLESPCERTEPPKQARTTNEIKYFNEEETERFLAILDRPMICPRSAHDRTDDTGKPYHVGEYVELQPIHPQHRLFFYMALLLGCRKGELLALQWQDIDFEKSTVSITKSTGYINKQIITKEPKNKTSVRVISIPSMILVMLQEYRKEQLAEAFRLGTAWEGKRSIQEYDQNYIFTQWNGLQMHPSTPYHVFQKIIHRYNAALPPGETPLPVIPLHGLRHTSATLLISQNVDVRTVSGRLGHAQTSTTMNIYAHSLKKSDEMAAEKLESLLIRKNS